MSGNRTAIPRRGLVGPREAEGPDLLFVALGFVAAVALGSFATCYLIGLFRSCP